MQLRVQTAYQRNATTLNAAPNRHPILDNPAHAMSVSLKIRNLQALVFGDMGVTRTPLRVAPRLWIDRLVKTTQTCVE